MARFKSALTTAFLAAATFIATPHRAAADPIEIINLSGVTFNGNISALGSFDFDPVTDIVTDVNVDVFGPPTGDDNFFASGPVAFDTILFNTNSPKFELFLVPANPSAGNLNLIAQLPLGSSNDPLAIGSTGSVSAFEINGGAAGNIIEPATGGSLNPAAPTTATPEPSTLPVLGAGILGGAALLILKRRKAEREPMVASKSATANQTLSL